MTSSAHQASPPAASEDDSVSSLLQRHLEEGRFVLTADLLPPKGGGWAGLASRAACLRDTVTAVNVADMPSAVLAQSPLAASVLLLSMGVEPVLQLTCRDRNVLALQADLLAAHALGIRNILGLTGDHVRFGDHPGAKPVFDISATDLLLVIAELNAGRSAAGGSLDGPCHFFAGAAANPTQTPLEPQLLRTLCKSHAGAKFFQTQPLFHLEQWHTFEEQLRDHAMDTPVLVGTFLLESPGMARFMHHKVPGVVIPDSVMTGIERTEDPSAYGRALVRDLIEALRESGVAGVHLMTHNRFETVAELSHELNIAEKSGTPAPSQPTLDPTF
ncbi:MAG: methylenetetrahydrofolate reductase [Thermoleophilia bacterium]|nr:methylenetetrahydrofolate reductase [Thermoleophilia bacterium]